MSLCLRILVILLALPALSRAQHFPFPDIEEARAMPELALRDGLKAVDIVEFDSGNAPRYSAIRFHMQHDSLWESARLEEWRGVDSSVTLYDTGLRVLFSAKYRGSSGGRTSNYLQYDDQNRLTKSTELDSHGNSASISQLRYNETGDTCWILEYRHSSQPSSVETSVLDSKGRVVHRTKNGIDTAWSVEHIVKYDNLGRQVEELTRTNKNAYLNFAAGIKRIFQDSVGILKCRTYHWIDSVWADRPTSEWSYDSLARRKSTTNFSSKSLTATTQIDDYDSSAKLVHASYDDPNIHFRRVDDYSYGSHGELLSYEMKHNGHPYIKTIYHYTYHK